MNNWQNFGIIIGALLTMLLVHTFGALKAKITDPDRLLFWKVLIVFLLISAIRGLLAITGIVPDGINIYVGIVVNWSLVGFVIYYVNLRYLE